MDRFILCPLLGGYSFSPGQNIIEQQLQGGMPRQRRNFIGAVYLVSASVFCGSYEEKEYFWAFWRKQQREPKNWLWALQSDSYKFEDHECRFKADSLPQESEREGKLIKYSFQIYVKPLNRPADLDDMIVSYWGSGLNPKISNLLEKLANESIPNALRSYK
ncbi:hypothetical protein QR665_14675 [Acinetobacter gerneri]|uniref:hypothetical protein n=1 Tax=Acinetobacter gerneri TaxID=202952 RepID=UPI002935BA8F|nr:hypothetical protein [Acinetobacter gerneri]MDV2440705.1 hypothetical protein [Acinetobacter gerneri]